MRFLVCLGHNGIVFSIRVSLGTLVHALLTLLRQSWLVTLRYVGA